MRLAGGAGLLAVLLLCLFGFSGVYAAEPAGIIDKIRFVGNKVTKERVLRQEMLVSEGDPVNMAKIEKSRQAIMNLGLFKSVKAEVVQKNGANILIITVDERYYFLPLPLLDARVAEKQYSYGLDLRYDNLLGLNHRLKVTYENKKTVKNTVPLEKQASLDYHYPRIRGSLNNLDLSGKMTRSDINDQMNGSITGSYRFDTLNTGFRVSRWLNPEEISQGWLFGIGMLYRQQMYSEQTGSALAYRDSQALEVDIGMDYAAVKEFPYHREGIAYGYGLALALPDMGSDYSYNSHSFYLRNYRSLKAQDANLNTQLKLGLANGSSFGLPAFSVGGGSSLRGYEPDAAIGNAMLQLNVEYHKHLTGYPQLRGVVFTDTGNAWPGVMEVDLGKLLTSVGLGLRWRVQSFVNVTLRIDTAYALDTKKTKVYAGTSASF